MMNELQLKFKNENGEIKRIPVLTEEFFVGRHSENDLSIANSAVSRRHLKIERFAEMFVVSDIGSTLGTKLNGEKLTAPVVLKKGDRLELGGGFEIEIGFGSDEEIIAETDDDFQENAENGEPENVENENENSLIAPAVSESPKAENNSVPVSFFYIAPVLGLVVLLLVGGIFLWINSGKENEISQSKDDLNYSGRQNRRIDEPPNDSETPFIETNSTSENSVETNLILPENNSVNSTGETNLPPSNSGKNTDELTKIEQNSASFLRRIAQKDPRAFLTGERQKIVQSKIVQFKNSSALAANLRSAKQNAGQIQTLANQKNLRPQFLTSAALAKLGNSQGDVLAAAQNMAEVLDELSRNIGDEFADDSLIVIAAYEQGAAGKTLEMRNMLQGLTDQFPESSRRIRTIWFLKDNNKISESQFEFALRFLAVGTISQNPRDFGVNAEAVKF